MSVSGLCQICESAEARDTCERCGRVVCAQHYDEAFGLCLECSEGADTGSDTGGGDQPGRDDVGDDVQF